MQVQYEAQLLAGGRGFGYTCPDIYVTVIVKQLNEVSMLDSMKFYFYFQKWYVNAFFSSPEIDMEGTIAPDTDPPQQMGDPKLEVCMYMYAML